MITVITGPMSSGKNLIAKQMLAKRNYEYLSVKQNFQEGFIWHPRIDKKTEVFLFEDFQRKDLIKLREFLRWSFGSFFVERQGRERIEKEMPDIFITSSEIIGQDLVGYTCKQIFEINTTPKAIN